MHLDDLPAAIVQSMDLLSTRGHAAYFGEDVTILEHSLQCACFALQVQSQATAIAAALLHDIGHLLHHLPETIARQGIDTRHEELAANYLAHCFGPAVTTPIRMHVAAKRYLCATKADYFSLLSPSSVQSLALQGGPMNPTELEIFREQPFAAEATLLRQWDDRAKIAKLAVPNLESYLPILREAARSAPPMSAEE